LLLVGIAASLSSCAARPSPELIAARGAPLFTAHSFFYHNGQHLTTNYRTGTLVPINTEVQIINSDSKTIKVRIADSGQIIDITNIADYSGEDINGIFHRMFSPAPTDLSRFPDRQRDLIRTGNAGLGMSKETVVKALGYPPSHKTPSLDDNTWTYWRNRFRTFVVDFESDKVASISD
jgi:hypothetical protein